MITLESIIARDAQFSRRCCASVEVDRRFPTVAIDWPGADGDGPFLQGADAEQFLADVEALAVDAPGVSREDIELHLARPYLECL